VHSDGCMRRLFSEGIFGILSSETLVIESAQ